MSARAFIGGGIALVLLGLGAGCGKSEPKFVLHAKTTDLTPGAERAVAKLLTENFGTPLDMVGWQRLPVEFGGHVGTIEAVPEGTAEGRRDVLQVRFEPPLEADQFERGQELTFTSGEYDGRTVRVLEYKADEGALTLQQPLEVAPAEGDTVMLGFGDQLRAGRQAYMVHCQHCHGVSGDGNGPTAQYLVPRPRDYRLGKFKFKSTARDDRPQRDDLKEIIANGIPGTYMPSFLLLPENDRDAIIEYVLWLTMRGEYEQKMVSELRDAYSKTVLDAALANQEAAYQRWQAKKEGLEPTRPTRDSVQKELIETVALTTVETLPEKADELATEIAEAWTVAQAADSVIRPKEPRSVLPVSQTDGGAADSEAGKQAWQESLQRGFELFQKNCNNCHGPTGRGDGAQTESFQALPENPNATYDEPGLYDDWGNKISPRDLTRGVYRGGRQPIDIYRRIHQGIPGTPMPPLGGKLSDAEIWDLVNYVLSVPYRRDAEPMIMPEPSDPLPVEAEKTRVGDIPPAGANETDAAPVTDDGETP